MRSVGLRRRSADHLFGPAGLVTGITRAGRCHVQHAAKGVQVRPRFYQVTGPLFRRGVGAGRDRQQRRIGACGDRGVEVPQVRDEVGQHCLGLHERQRNKAASDDDVELELADETEIDDQEEREGSEDEDADSDDAATPIDTATGPWKLLGSYLPWGTHPLTRTTTGGWTASAVERLAVLLRARNVPIGVTTNGRWWALVWAPPGGPPARLRPRKDDMRAIQPAPDGDIIHPNQYY